VPLVCRQSATGRATSEQPPLSRFFTGEWGTINATPPPIWALFCKRHPLMFSSTLCIHFRNYFRPLFPLTRFVVAQFLALPLFVFADPFVDEFLLMYFVIKIG